MTEAEWLASEDPTPMLAFIRDKSNERMLRLFSVACVGRLTNLLTGNISRMALKVGERWADGVASETEDELYALETGGVAYAKGLSGAEWPTGWNAEEMAAYYAAIAAAECVRGGLRTVSDWVEQVDWISQASSDAVGYGNGGLETSTREAEFRRTHNGERASHAALLRDIFGNPFRPVAFDPSWLTSTVTALAGQMYESRDFSPMPILADALEDAGCNHLDILAHCRADVPHVRGCWVVDLVLGKT